MHYLTTSNLVTYALKETFQSLVCTVDIPGKSGLCIYDFTDFF